MAQRLERKDDQRIAKNSGNDEIHCLVVAILRTRERVLHENYNSECVDAFGLGFEGKDRYQGAGQ
jgi:hypothetical protein